MNARFTGDMETFGPLHDIVQAGITDKILLARRKLAEGEYNIMRSHEGSPGLKAGALG